MAGYALHPRLTAAILAGAEIGCAEEVLTIIAHVNGETGKSIFVTYSTVQTKMKIVSANGMGAF